MRLFEKGKDRTLNAAVIYHGDCLDFLPKITAKSVQLIVTSPPYNIGKSYEKRKSLHDYLFEQRKVITELVRVLKDGGSICWQVGNFISNNEAVPLDVVFYPVFKDLGLKLRNRIIWHFEHGLHCSKRFSGRYETILWFTKGDQWKFRLDAVRVPQKYPNKKYFKGPKVGQLSSNPLGKNPGDVWVIPNVKHNHVEKTIHPCQFPVELVERLILALTDSGDTVLDPYGAEILQVRFPKINREIDAIIASVKVTKKTKVSREKTKMGVKLFAPVEINKKFLKQFRSRGYREIRDRYDIKIPNWKHTVRGAFKQVDFTKGSVLVEVQFGKYAFMFYDMAKFQYFFNENKCDVGIEVVPCHALQSQMSSGVSYGEQLVYDIERLKRHFPAVPVKVIFVDIPLAPQEKRMREAALQRQPKEELKAE